MVVLSKASRSDEEVDGLTSPLVSEDDEQSVRRRLRLRYRLHAQWSTLQSKYFWSGQAALSAVDAKSTDVLSPLA